MFTKKKSVNHAKFAMRIDFHFFTSQNKHNIGFGNERKKKNKQSRNRIKRTRFLVFLRMFFHSRKTHNGKKKLLFRTKVH